MGVSARKHFDISDYIKVKKNGQYIKAVISKEVYGYEYCATISLGNSKLNDNVGIFNLLVGLGCFQGGQRCQAFIEGTCYNFGPEDRWPVVKECRQKNYHATKSIYFSEMMISIIEKAYDYGMRYFRIHESGDFYDWMYLTKWESIISYFENYKDIVFYTYSRVPNQWLRRLDRYENVNVVRSLIDGHLNNFGPKEYIIELAKRYRVKICPSGLTKSKVTCIKDCFACLTADQVVFLEHEKKKRG